MGYVKSNRKIERKYLLFVSINCRGVDRVGGWGGGDEGVGMKYSVVKNKTWISDMSTVF